MKYEIQAKHLDCLFLSIVLVKLIILGGKIQKTLSLRKNSESYFNPNPTIYSILMATVTLRVMINPNK